MLGNAFVKMTSYLRGMAGAAERIAEGDLTTRVTPQSERGLAGQRLRGDDGQPERDSGPGQRGLRGPRRRQGPARDRCRRGGCRFHRGRYDHGPGRRRYRRTGPLRAGGQQLGGQADLLGGGHRGAGQELRGGGGRGHGRARRRRRGERRPGHRHRPRRRQRGAEDCRRHGPDPRFRQLGLGGDQEAGRALSGDRQDRGGDRRHRGADQPAGAERGDRGGAGRRAGPRLRRGRRRSPQAGGSVWSAPPRRSPS